MLRYCSSVFKVFPSTITVHVNVSTVSLINTKWQVIKLYKLKFYPYLVCYESLKIWGVQLVNDLVFVLPRHLKGSSRKFCFWNTPHCLQMKHIKTLKDINWFSRVVLQIGCACITNNGLISRTSLEKTKYYKLKVLSLSNFLTEVKKIQSFFCLDY